MPRVTQPACESCLRLTITNPCKHSSILHRCLTLHATTMKVLKMGAQATATFVTTTRSGVPQRHDPTPHRVRLSHRHCRAALPTHLNPLKMWSSGNGRRLMEKRGPSPDRQPSTLTKRGFSRILSRPTLSSALRSRQPLIRFTRMTLYLPRNPGMTPRHRASL